MLWKTGQSLCLRFNDSGGYWLGVVVGATGAVAGGVGGGVVVGSLLGGAG